MRFVKTINEKKYTLLSIFLFLYVVLNLIDGERGLIQFYEKKEIKKQLILEKDFLSNKLHLIEKENSLLTDKIDIDYLETLYRKKFMLGKKGEKIYLNN